MTTRFRGTAFFILAGALAALGRPAAGQTIATPPAAAASRAAAASSPLAAPSPLERSMEAVPAPAGGQRYDGVVPGAGTKNPLPALPKSGTYLVWTGFQMTETGSRVFLQTNQPVQFDLDEGRVGRSGKSTLTVKLEDCRIFMANNRRRIDTRFFATPVSGVSARQKGHNVAVHIALREVANAVPHTEAGPDGTQFVILDFPPGKATPEPTALEDMAKASGMPSSGPEDDADNFESTSTRPTKRAPKSRR